MFRPLAMQQVEILLLRRDLVPAMRTLAAARIIHLYRLEAGTAATAADPQLERYHQFLAHSDRLAKDLDIDPAGGRLLAIDDFPAWESWVGGLGETLLRLRLRQREGRRCRLRLIALALLLQRAGELQGACRILTELRFSALELGLLPTTALAELAALPEGCRVYPLARIGRQSLIAVLALRRNQTTLAETLTSLRFVPLHRFQHLRGGYREISTRLRRVRARLRARQNRLRRKVDSLRQTNAHPLRDRLASVTVEVHLLEERQGFGFTRRTVAIGGWASKRRLRELRSRLQAVCGTRYQLQEMAACSDATPVLLANPAPLRPFQRILAVLGTPGYREVEPTPLLAGGFLLLFGLMFGDFGHGLVLVLAGLLLRWRSRWPDVGVIMTEVGCVAALFGLLFGSCFGWEGLMEPLWFSPMHDIPRLMVIAVALGAALMIGGMLLRIVNGWGEEPAAEVLSDRFGMAGLLFYLGCLVLGYLVYHALLPPTVLVLAALPLVAVFCHPLTRPREQGVSISLLCAEGAVEVLETVLGLLANTFSFLRVAAFGLAHVGLSMATFALADQLLPLPLGVVLAALVHLLGNLVILILEGLVVSIQAVRLEFYEFFGKFFRGGGVPFTPLALDPATERKP